MVWFLKRKNPLTDLGDEVMRIGIQMEATRMYVDFMTAMDKALDDYERTRFFECTGILKPGTYKTDLDKLHNYFKTIAAEKYGSLEYRK